MWNYCRDESTDPLSSNLASFRYKTSITRNTPDPDCDNNKTKKVEIVVKLKHLSDFWRKLNILLINCEVSLTLTLHENYVLAGMIVRDSILQNCINQ